MEARAEILKLEDVQLLVNTFYSKVQADDLLGSIFNSRIENRWPEHLQKMYSFWQTLLLNEHTYNGRPFPPHATLPVKPEHFERWKSLFIETVDSLFTGQKAEEAKQRAANIAKMFELKVAHFQGHPGAIL